MFKKTLRREGDAAKGASDAEWRAMQAEQKRADDLRARRKELTAIETELAAIVEGVMPYTDINVLAQTELRLGAVRRILATIPAKPLPRTLTPDEQAEQARASRLAGLPLAIAAHRNSIALIRRDELSAVEIKLNSPPTPKDLGGYLSSLVGFPDAHNRALEKHFAHWREKQTTLLARIGELERQIAEAESELASLQNQEMRLIK